MACTERGRKPLETSYKVGDRHTELARDVIDDREPRIRLARQHALNRFLASADALRERSGIELLSPADSSQVAGEDGT